MTPFVALVDRRKRKALIRLLLPLLDGLSTFWHVASPQAKAAAKASQLAVQACLLTFRSKSMDPL